MRRLAAALCCVAWLASACSVIPTPTSAPTTAPSVRSSPTLTTGVLATGDLVDEPTPTPRPTLTPLPSDPNCVHGTTFVVATQLYEGTCWGWRVGPEHFDTGDVWSQDLEIGCDGKLYGDSIETSGPPWEEQPSDLDIFMRDVPDGARFEHIDKWTCGTHGLSDHAVLTLNPDEDFEPIQVDFARWLDASGWLVTTDTVPGSVRSCRIAGLPAVCIERAPLHAFAFTFAMVFVLEDSSLNPHGTVLRLYSDSDSVALEDLVRHAEMVERS